MPICPTPLCHAPQGSEPFVALREIDDGLTTAYREFLEWPPHLNAKSTQRDLIQRQRRGVAALRGMSIDYGFRSGAVAEHADLTDAQWARLEPLLPRGKKARRPPKWSRRQIIDGIRWRTRVGAPWRDVPDRYGCWQTVHGLFRRWQRAGIGR
ncbi:transposase [Nocardia sp. NPDC057663]|uniref:transposase n=1 Tax=Nocardia sp. NPDC057663 TaxID=3346201 RepID=UPI00366B594C